MLAKSYGISLQCNTGEAAPTVSRLTLRGNEITDDREGGSLLQYGVNIQASERMDQDA